LKLRIQDQKHNKRIRRTREEQDRIAQREKEKYEQRIKTDYLSYRKDIYDLKDQVTAVISNKKPTTFNNADGQLREFLKILSTIRNLYKQAINYEDLKPIIIECRAAIESKIVETYDIMSHKTSSRGRVRELYNRVYCQRIQPGTSPYLGKALKPIEDDLLTLSKELDKKQAIGKKALVTKKVTPSKRNEELICEYWVDKIKRAHTENDLQIIQSELEKILENKPSHSLQKRLNLIIDEVKLRIFLLQQNKTPNGQLSIAKASGPKEPHQAIKTEKIDGMDNIKAELILWYNKACEELKRCNYQLHNVSEIKINIPILNDRYPRIEVAFKNGSYAASLTSTTGKIITISKLNELPAHNDYLWLLQVVLVCYLADLTKKPMEVIVTNNRRSKTSSKVPIKKPLLTQTVRNGIIIRQPQQNTNDKRPTDSASQEEAKLVTGYVRRLPAGYERSIKQSMLYAALTGADPLELDRFSDGRKRTFVLEYYRNRQNSDNINIIELINETGCTSLAKPVEIYVNTFLGKRDNGKTVLKTLNGK